MSKVISPRMIYDEISTKVVGQEAAKVMIANAVFLHFVRYCQSVQEQRIIKKSNALLLGPTGCGKTYIVREASKAMQKLTGLPICPVLEVDCTEITSRGWEGESLSELIAEHYKEFQDNESIFNTSIIFLDEFDKLCLPATNSHGDDHNRKTQYNILKIMEGTDVKFGGKMGTIKYNTEKLMFVLAGNFAQVRSARKMNKRSIGFTDVRTETEKLTDVHLELEKAGMATQLVGRTPYVAELNELTQKELRIILDDHIIPEYADTWKYLNQSLKITAATKKKIVEGCFKRKTGARGLHTDLSRSLEKQLFDTEFEI